VGSERQDDKSPKPRRHAVYAAEATGLLLIAFFLLVLAVIRYWHVMRWSWR
jgi:hypothetical protein